MAKAKTESQAATCTYCTNPIGDREHPVLVEGKTWCPRCFVAIGMHQEPGRFSPASTASVRCQFCPWITVCFTVAVDGAACTCAMCGSPGAIRLPNQHEPKAREIA